MNLLTLLPPGYTAIQRIENTKNPCFSVISPENDRLFVKVFQNKGAALTEIRFLQFLDLFTRYYTAQAKSIVTVPKVINIFDDPQYIVVVCQFVEGKNVKDLILAHPRDIYRICSQLIVATALIHQWLSSFSDDLYVEGSLRTFSNENDCQTRTEQLLHSEGAVLLTLEEVKVIQARLGCYFEILFDVARGFPCDFYKDANPSNWILKNGSSTQLISVDFETKRTLPFIVDALNILEFASHYISTRDKSSLLNLYLDYRAYLDPDWGKSVQRFNIEMIFDLFGVYRHNEQLLHRMRDLGRSETKNIAWHKDAFIYHKNMMIAKVESLERFLPAEKARTLTSEISKVVALYESSLQRIDIT